MIVDVVITTHEHQAHVFGFDEKAEMEAAPSAIPPLCSRLSRAEQRQGWTNEFIGLSLSTAEGKDQLL